MMRPTRANKPDGYLLGSYRIATAPEPNSSRPTSFRSTCFDSPANSVGPWPASLGCTMNSYSSINPSSANASGSFTPPTNSPLPDSRLSCSTAFPRSPRTSSAFQSTRSRVLDTTYFFAMSILRAKGSIQSGLAPVRAGGRLTMQVFVHDADTVVTAAVQCDVDGIPKGTHCVMSRGDRSEDRFSICSD